MEYLLLAIVILLVGVIAYLLWSKNADKTMAQEKGLMQRKAAFVQTQNGGLVPSKKAERMGQLMVQLEKLPAETVLQETRLMEIKDSKVLAKVMNAVPELAQTGVAGATAANVAGETLYRAILPQGAELVASTDGNGLVRGFFRDVEKKIRGHANLEAVTTGGVTVANTTAAAMNAASLVVGQYYMSQIDDKLEGITSEIEKVADFQDNEYNGKVFALMAQVQKIANFQSEILMNEELRKNEASNINSLEQTCIELLGQANIAVKGFSQHTKLDYKGYENEIENARNWYVYQKTLYEILAQLGELKYTLYLGQMSHEQCASLPCLYAKQAEEALLELQGWHQTQIERFKINIDESVRKRAGFDALVHFLPGLVDEKHKYRSIPECVLTEIQVQTEAYAIAEHSSAPELYQEDVNIIAKDGKVYFLLPESNATI